MRFYGAGQNPSYRNIGPQQGKQVHWQYRQGMRLGKGQAMSQIEVDRLYESTGNGTLSNPKIYYNTNIDFVSSALIRECERVVKDEARRLGMTCAIIR